MEKQPRLRRQSAREQEFWRAVIVMRNHVIVNCRPDYVDAQGDFWVDGTLWWAINIVGDQLDNAINERWLHTYE